jgi:hypothetical protein
MSISYWLKSTARYSARWALIILFIAASSTSTQAQMTRTMAQEIYSKTVKPADAMGLLQNVKFAMDRGLLLREDFYVDSVLERFFGGSRVIWQNYPIWKKWGGISEFGFLTEGSPSSTRTWDGLGIRFGWSAMERGRAKSLLSINFNSLRSPSANDVQRVSVHSGGKKNSRPRLTDRSRHRRIRLGTDRSHTSTRAQRLREPHASISPSMAR